MSAPVPRERDWIASAAVCREVAELPDRAACEHMTPDDMLVTVDELNPIVGHALAAAREEGRREERERFTSALREPSDELVEQWSRLTAPKIWRRIDENANDVDWSETTANNLRRAILRDDKKILKALAQALELIEVMADV